METYKGAMLRTTPLEALVDLVFVRKLRHVGLPFLELDSDLEAITRAYAFVDRTEGACAAAERNRGFPIRGSAPSPSFFVSRNPLLMHVHS